MTNSVQELKKLLMLFGVQDARVKVKMLDAQSHASQQIDFMNNKINGFLSSEMTLNQNNAAQEINFESNADIENLNLIEASNNSNSVDFIENDEDKQTISFSGSNNINITIE